MNAQIHVFVGCFASREDACRYTEAQWEPEPDENACDEAYAEWEDRNPTWALRADLGGVYLDADFIETIDGDGRYEYLATYLADTEDLAKVKYVAPHANILCLVFSEALGGFPVDLHSTSRLIYCGGFCFRRP